MTAHYLIFNADIDASKVQTFISWTIARRREGATSFYIVFTTGGGNVSAGILMANFIRSLDVEVTMHNVSSVGSIGIPIFCSATTRYSSSLAQFIFHGAGLHSSDRLDEAKLKDLLDTVSNQNNAIAESISETSGMVVEECRNLLRGEISKSSEWATLHGICHEVRELSLPPGVNPVTLF